MGRHGYISVEAQGARVYNAPRGKGSSGCLKTACVLASFWPGRAVQQGATDFTFPLKRFNQNLIE